MQSTTSIVRHAKGITMQTIAPIKIAGTERYAQILIPRFCKAFCNVLSEKLNEQFMRDSQSGGFATYIWPNDDDGNDCYGIRFWGTGIEIRRGNTPKNARDYATAYVAGYAQSELDLIS